MLKVKTKFILAQLAALGMFAAVSAQADFMVREVNVSPGASVTVDLLPPMSDTASTTAGIYNIEINDGVITQWDSFCIDLGHYSTTAWINYESTQLALAPIWPTGPMGAVSAANIERLWEKYYLPTMSATDAAALQLAIWNQTALGVGNYSWSFTAALAVTQMYGTMNTWLAANPSAARANLTALVSLNNQAFVVEGFVDQTVPDGGATAAMLGLSILGLGLVIRRKS